MQTWSWIRGVVRGSRGNGVDEQGIAKFRKRGEWCLDPLLGSSIVRPLYSAWLGVLIWGFFMEGTRRHQANPRQNISSLCNRETMISYLSE